MNEWKEYTVQDLIDQGMLAEPMDGNHGSIHPKSSDYVSEGVPFIMANDLVNGVADLINCSFISEKQAKTLKKGFAHPNDVLLTHKATIGRTAIVPNKYETIILTPQVTYYRVLKGIDNRYLKYYFDSDFFQSTLRNWAGSGSIRAYIGITAQRKLPIILPPLNVQTKIATVLSLLDEKISLNIAINENLEQQAQAIFKSWFVDFEPFGGVMPDDWSECILDSMCSLIIKGITPKYNEHSAQLVINQKCVRNHQIDLSLARCHEPKKVNEKWLQYGDIIVNSTGTGTLGRAAQVLFTPNNMTVDSHVTIIRASKQEYIYYLGLWATSHEHDFEMLQTGSTGQTDLPRERLKQMQIVLPSDSILSSFSKVIKPIADIRIQKQQENQRLSALRDTLLPKLMNGEIDVSAVQV